MNPEDITHMYQLIEELRMLIPKNDANLINRMFRGYMDMPIPEYGSCGNLGFAKTEYLMEPIIDWVKCSERLPNRDEHIGFLFVDGKVEKSGEIWFDQGCKEWMEDSCMDSYGPCKRNVTHWYPKPKMPDAPK